MAWNAKQAADFLGVQPKTARALAARGEIPAVKVGKLWRYDETTLLEWLQLKARENLKTCPSVVAKVRVTGRSNSRSLATKLDSLLESQTGEPPKNSKSSSDPPYGKKSDSASSITLGKMP